MRKRRQVPGDQSAPRHSLRLRLALWYGTLLTVALAVFSVLILLLTADANRQSVDNALRAEARLATVNLRRELLPTPPYWPDQLTLNIVDIYHNPGVIVEVQDAQGGVRYLSSSRAALMIPADPGAIQAALDGQVSWYDAQANGEHIRVEVVPVRAPDAASPGGSGDGPSGGVDADGAPVGSGPVIGALLITKSLSDVDKTFDLLWRLLLLGGLAILVGALAGGWLIAARVLRPLGEIGATARAIVASTADGHRLGTLSQRVPRSGGKDELAQVVETLNEMLAALERASQTQQRFVADASHELRAPLTTVQGNLAFLQRHLEEVPPDERRIMLADAYTETLRLARLVDDLLLLARADTSTDQPGTPSEATGQELPPLAQASPVELDHALLQLVRQLRRRLNAEGSQLHLEVGRIEPTRVRGEEEALRRVILILLDNAIKYTPASDEPGRGRVTVSLERVDGQAVLGVRDTGIGIEPADLPHIFERFYRADPVRDRHGTGLGLSIAQKLMEQLGGHITVESAPGQGSTFSIWLPLA
ncbi:MAG TPA: HAMP domain-containing sensor histidine kinase [Ktedonobacterales bacterium]|jgi:signal transduction histidine kinase